MSRIQKLCSGICTTLQSQVKLNSLSDVVRELVQNGVDADSSSISIKVYVNYSENSIELSYSDDGIGMDPETLEVFGKRNYTSKLTTELNSENLDLSVLSDVHTFGFRGEAMNSLRKLCDTVIVISRTVGYNNAFKAIFKSDEMIGDVVRHPFVFPRGTSIKVLGLFDSVVIRKKLLLEQLKDSWITDTFEIRKEVFNSMIDKPRIKINIERVEFKNGKWTSKKVLTSGLPRYTECVPFQLQMKLLNLTFGGSISENYEICKVEYQGYKLKIGIGTTVSQSKKFQFAYINGRPLVNQEFFKFVNILFQKGYEKWGTTVKYDANKPSSMYGRPYSVNPIFVAYFNLPFEVDDLIQDPKKYCYNTKHLPILQRMLSKSVDIYFEIFCNHKIRENGEYHSEYIPVKKQKIQHHYISDMKADIRKLNLKDSEAERRLSNEDIHTMGKNVVFESGEIQEGLTSRSMSPKTRGTMLAIDETKPAEACECEKTRNIEINSQVPYSQKDLKNTSKFFSRQDNLMITRESIKQFKIVGQVESKFILVKFRNMLIGMDQHASDERINLEKTYQSLIQKSIDQVYHQVNEVRRVSFHPSDLELIKRYEDTLKFWGIMFDPEFTKITHLPELVYRKVSKLDLRLLEKGIIEFVYNLHNSEKREMKLSEKHQNDDRFWWVAYITHMPALYRETIKSYSCRQSIMFGEQLTRKEMELIITRLEACYQPFECAHGRPSLYPICTLL